MANPASTPSEASGHRALALLDAYVAADTAAVAQQIEAEAVRAEREKRAEGKWIALFLHAADGLLARDAT